MRKTLIVVFLCALLNAGVHAATVYMKDGRQIKGTVVSATARDVLIHTEKGEVTLDSGEILRIEYSDVSPGEQPVSPPAAQPPPLPSRQGRARAAPQDIEDLNQMFVLDVGLNTPLSRVDAADTGGSPAKNGGTSLRLGVEYLFHLSSRFGVGLDFHYFNRSGTDNFSLIPFGHSSVSGNTIMPLAVAKYTLIARGRSRPYFLAGIGANHTSMVIDAEPLPGFAWSDTGTFEARRLVDESLWGLAARAAVGIDFHANEPTVFSFELGWLGVANDRYQATQAGRDVGLDSVTGNLNALSISLRWGWRF